MYKSAKIRKLDEIVVNRITGGKIIQRPNALKEIKNRLVFGNDRLSRYVIAKYNSLLRYSLNAS